MHRRTPPFLVLGMIVVAASCSNLTGAPNGGGTPIGIVLMNARTKGAGYTTYPRVNFYSVGSASFSFSTVNTDTCRVGPYDSTATSTTTATQIGGGALLLASLSGQTDSLYKAATGDRTYHLNNLAGMPFNPGDSVSFNFPGDVVGFPPMQAVAATAEPFTIIRPTIPAVGLPMVVQWTPATDNNAAMYVSLLYNTPGGAGGATALNTQIFCDFHDIGQGTVQSYLLPSLASSSVPFVMHAQRLRTLLQISSIGLSAYLNVISTFEVPTPVSP